MTSFLVFAVAYIVSQFFRSFVAVLGPVLWHELALTPTELAALPAAWFIAFAVVQYPVGVALDRLGPRVTTAAGLMVTALGAAAFASGETAEALIAAMAVIGAGCSPILVGALYVFSRSYPAHKFSFLAGAMVGVGLAGGLLSTVPAALLFEWYGWRAVMMAVAVVTGALAASARFIDAPRPAARSPQASDGRIAASLWTAIRPLWPIMPFCLLSYGVLAAVRHLWVGPYLTEVHDWSITESATGALAVATGMMLGAVAFGSVDKLLGAKRAVVIGGTAAGGLLIGLSAVGHAPSVAPLLGLLLCLGGFGMTYGAVLSHVRTFLPSHALGRGITLFNLLFVAGAGAVQALSGIYMDHILDTGAPPAAAFARLHLTFGIATLLVTVMYLAAPAKPAAEAHETSY